tara:strand:- start:2508 stop:2726 length:219 start_codon:yes stop_codon:yes gene_type:complete
MKIDKTQYIGYFVMWNVLFAALDHLHGDPIEWGSNFMLAALLLSALITGILLVTKTIDLIQINFEKKTDQLP